MQHSLHSDLADEDEHVERTGPSQVDRDGAVHDGQAPAPASSSLGDHARHPPIPPYQYSKKQMASKLATSSSSSAAVGERAARTTVEPTCSHRRHERRERGDQRHSRGQHGGNFFYLSIRRPAAEIPSSDVLSCLPLAGCFALAQCRHFGSASCKRRWNPRPNWVCTLTYPSAQGLQSVQYEPDNRRSLSSEINTCLQHPQLDTPTPSVRG